MKTTVLKLISLVLLSMVCSAVDARSWQINNKVHYLADFHDINAAMASSDVVDGDTLYLGAGFVSESSQDIKKRVTVIGTGWGYDDSPAVCAKINSTLAIKASGVKLVGLYVIGNINIQTTCHAVCIERCRFNQITLSGSYTNNDFKIHSCRFNRISLYNNTGWEVKNCIVESTSSLMSNFNNAVFENNVFVNSGGGVVIEATKYSVIRNNIIVCGSNGADVNSVNVANLVNDGNNTVTDNVMTISPEYGDKYPGNVYAGTLDYAAIFKCSGSVNSGEYYMLAEGSPAIGAGTNGSDCGIMGGVYKFAPYGRPDNIPVIKKFTASDTPTNGKINVTIGF